MLSRVFRLSAILLTLALLSVANAELKIDFSSTSQDGGPHNQLGWQAYEAGHEVIADFTTRNYAAFGTTVSVTPSWPNTTDNRVQQSIDRGAGFDSSWDNSDGYLDLVTDFIGIDTRTGNGGNGDWDGSTGTPTYMLLTIGGLPARDYAWTSFHHDTEHVHGPFAVWVSTDGGSNFTQLADGVMTDGTTGGNPDSGATEGGPDAYTLSSTYTTTFTANGTDDVVMRFAPYSAIAVHRQIWGMNGFEIGNPGVASNPTPADGSQVPPTDTADDGHIYMLMTFDAGDGAISHNAYFSDNYDDVANHASGANIGAPPFPAIPTSYYVGLDDSNLPDNAREEIQAGITYYWTVVEFDGVEDIPGPVWSYTIIPEQAWDPTPPDGDERVDPDPNATVSWQLGSADISDGSLTFEVFYGTVLNDVTTATVANRIVTDTTAEIGPLGADTIHYWRVDTVLTLARPPFTRTVTTGDVWQFKTIPVVPILDEDLVGWWKLDGDIVPGLAFDSSGHANHGTLTGDPQWVVDGKVDGALEFDGLNDIVVVKQNSGLPIYNSGTDNAYSITMWVNGGPQPDRRIFSEGSTSNNNPLFNLGTQNAGATGQFDVYIRPVGMNHTYSVAEPFDNTWHHIAWVDANGTATLYIDGVLDGGDFSYTRATLALNTTSIGGILRAASSHFFTGQIDDVRAYKRTLSIKEIKIMAGLLSVSDPDPANGATDVPQNITLGWSPGAFAATASGNELYFSEDASDVQNRIGKITLTDSTYPVPTTLDLGTTYYWVVDTVNGVDSWPGDIWSFTSLGWLSVDNMETYTPWNITGNNIFEAWRDGMGNCVAGNGNDTGANLTENVAPVFEGVQSMKYEYDNDGMVFNPCNLAQEGRGHLYSRIEAQVAGMISGIGTDWTIQGVRTLSLRFQGVATNDIEPMWVQLSDGTKAYGTKVAYGDYADEDPADIADEAWHEWLIDLDDFGVDLTNVASVSIGFGVEGSVTPGGSGTVYFDDIRLYTPRCLPQRVKPVGDFDNNCRIDYGDVDILFDNWLLQDIPETPMTGTWQNADIGDVNNPGSFLNLGGGAYSLTADGADIWNQADAFHFAFQPLSGNGKLTVQVTGITGPGTNGWIKVGAMIRETLDANSPNAFIAISGGSGGGETFQWRPEKGVGSVSSHTATGIAPPTCVRIVRIGDTFRGFYYHNGQWIQEGDAVTIPMSENVYIGLALTSHDINAMNTATFDQACSSEFVSMDLVDDKVINFFDYATLLQSWLDEVKYPQ